HDRRALPFSGADPARPPEAAASRAAPAKGQRDGSVRPRRLERAPETRRWPLAIPYPLAGIVVVLEFANGFLFGEELPVNLVLVPFEHEGPGIREASLVPRENWLADTGGLHGRAEGKHRARREAHNVDCIGHLGRFIEIIDAPDQATFAITPC